MWATVLLQAGGWAGNLQKILPTNVSTMSWVTTCVTLNEMHLVGGGCRKAQAMKKRKSRRLKPWGWHAFLQKQLFYKNSLIFCTATSWDVQQRGSAQPASTPLPTQAKDRGSRPSAMERTTTESLPQPSCILQPPHPMAEVFPTPGAAATAGHTSG